MAWCQREDRTAAPAITETLTDYATALADAGYAPSTIGRALSAIRTAHRAAGLPQPDTAGAALVLRDHRRQRAIEGITERRPAALTVAQLRQLVEACDPDTLAGRRDRALLLLAFALGARRSELVALDLDDVREVAEGLLVRIRTPKTDHESAGVDVAVTYGSRPDTCPVRAVGAWREALATHDRTSGPLFLRIDRHGRLGVVATGRGAAEGRLTGQAVGIILRRAAERAGMVVELVGDDALSAHSLRSGALTTCC